DPIAVAVRAVMAMRTEWVGTATDLLSALANTTDERVTKSKTWPDSPRALSGRLRRAATFLRNAGIEVSFGDRKGRAGARVIRITTAVTAGDQTSAAPEGRWAQSSAASALSAPLVFDGQALSVEVSPLS